MTVDPKAAHQPAPSPSAADHSRAPTGYARLARRLSSWTTNCILTVIVLVVGLSFGRQVLRWWDLDASNSPNSRVAVDVGDGLGELDRPQEIQFGAATWRIRRQPLAGSREQAVAGLRASCREATRSSSMPECALAMGEQQLLDSLSRRSPQDQEPGKWGIYHLDDHFPIVVGVREPTGPKQRVAQTGRRVVTWGLAVPISQGAWTLYTFSQRAPSAGSLLDISIPPHSISILSLETDTGGRLTAIKGQGGEEVWKSFFDQWFQTRGWAPAAPWRRLGATWSRRYLEKPEERAAKTDVQFGADVRGGLAGLLVSTPALRKPEGK
jgi:hypothetical protein